jgi:ApeA-like protein
MKFSEEQNHKVKLHHRDLGDLGEAQLRFGGEWGVVASMGLLSAGPRLDASRPLDFVSATNEDGHAFTLCECRIHGFSLIAAFLVYGSITENRYLQIDVRYSDISEWFLRPERVEGIVGEQLTWTSRSQHFSAEVTEGARRFTLSSKSVGSRERVGEDLILHEHVEFSFESSNDFSLKEVRDKANGLGALLSLLIAYPISIVSVEVYTKPDRAHPMYFATFNELQRDNTREFSIQCLLQKPRLDGQWPLILNNYYRDRERRDLWVPLAGMQRYEGFWDFRLLGYVGLLDRCVAQRTRAHPGGSSSPTQKVKKFAAALCRLTPALDAPVVREIVALAHRIFGDRDPSFAHRYAYAMGDTASDVRAVINLTNEDFELIKDVRDKIAHGEPPEVPDSDFTRVHIVIGKIALLLTYWTHHDLGISKEDFLGAMNATHNRLYLGASIDMKSLERATGTAPFFNVSADKFERLASRKDLRFDACFIEGPAGEIEQSEEYTARWKNWHSNPRRASGTFQWHIIFEVESEAVQYHGTVYVESGDRSLELSSVCIFDKSKLRRSDET